MPKIPLPNFPPEFPFMGKGPGIFTPGGYRSSLQNEAEMARRLGPYEEDEKKAFKDYSDEADNADMIGRPDVAVTLRSMSEDEFRHYLNIRSMLKDLRQY